MNKEDYYRNIERQFGQVWHDYNRNCHINAKQQQMYFANMAAMQGQWYPAQLSQMHLRSVKDIQSIGQGRDLVKAEEFKPVESRIKEQVFKIKEEVKTIEEIVKK